MLSERCWCLLPSLVRVKREEERVSRSLELGGLLGSLSSGALSDAWLRRNAAAGSPAGNLGLRVRVVIGYSGRSARAIATRRRARWVDIFERSVSMK